MMHEDNVEAGVVLTTTTMTMTVMRTTTGIAAKMPDGVRGELKALLERDEAGFAPFGGRGVPGGGGLTRVVLDAPMTMARARGSMPTGRSFCRRRPPRTSFTFQGLRLDGRRRRMTTTMATIRERGTRTRGQGSDDDDYDYNHTGRGRCNVEGR